MSDRHADTVSHAQPGTTTEKAPSALAPGVAVDNAARATDAQRERTFAAGGDTEEAAPLPAPVAVRSLVAEAIARIGGLDRPSPFGASQFPPLPVPSEPVE